MNSLITDFSNKELAGFFKSKISSFTPKKDEFEYLLRDNQFPKFSELIKVGEVTFNDSSDLLVFSCKYKGLLSERSSRKAQFEIARKVLKEDFKDGAIFVFYDDKGKFRFSFIRKNYGKKGADRHSTWKRFTYFIEPNNTNKTFKDRIGSCKFSNLESIQEAFSVEKLTKDFYNELFGWYQWTLSEEVGVTYPNNTKITEDDRVKLEEQVIRLITRVLFVWFIKQKGLVPNELFNRDKISAFLKDFDPESKKDGSYYNAILQNLFFATLNKAVPERDFAKNQKQDLKTLYRYDEMFSISKEEVIEKFRKIPFLNGGLFECLDKEDLEGNKYYLDGFSRNDTKQKGHFKHRAFIPNCVFFDPQKGLIPLLERYNFTVEENAPNEVQVALDPELLGNVFENLLGAFNKETQETARKQSGSFYTPKEVVNYMVDESLKAYLKGALPKVDEELIREIIEAEILPESLVKNKKLCTKISDTLKRVKILDPACGSGAYPMGVLNRMVDVLQKLGCGEENVYDQKLHLIEECIYGVDMQTIAVQISKLRFFISLIVEQKEMDMKKDNYGVLPLPNLETKFVAANTLIGLKKKKQGDFVNTLFDNDEIALVKAQILDIRHKHFYARSVSEKKRLREKDAERRTKLIELLDIHGGDNASDESKTLAHWNPYDQNESSPFFDPEWMFGLKDGFDIVIGNPPYLRIQGIRLSDSKFADFLVKEYKSATGSFDLYVVFTERSLQLIKASGIVNFIMPTKWTNSSFGSGLRQILSEKNAAHKIINFGAYQVFNASTYTGLQWFKLKSDDLLYFELNKDLKSNSELSNYLKLLDKSEGTVISSSALNKGMWTLTSNSSSKIIDKIRKQPRTVADVFEKVFTGLQTSLDSVYFLYDCSYEKNNVTGFSKHLNRFITVEKDITKPLLKGDDVHRYEKIKTDKVVVFPYKLIKEAAEIYKEKELKSSFPLCYSYLKECEKDLRDREKGRFNIDGEWFQFGRKQGIAFAAQEKLVAPEISFKSNFSYDKKGEFYSTTKIYGYIKNSFIKEDYFFWLGLFNSSLFWFFIRQTGYTLRGGYFTFKTNYILPFPIPETIPIDIYEQVRGLVKIRLEDKGKVEQELEKQIDALIFKLYDLKDSEIKMINV